MYRFILTPISAVILTAACGSSGSSNMTQESVTDTTFAPVETKNANTEYKPAFAGQTRVAGVKTTSTYEGKVLTSELKRPWGITSLPDGRFLVNEKEGTMRIVSSAGAVSAPLTGVPAVNSSGQGGLLGITTDRLEQDGLLDLLRKDQ